MPTSEPSLASVVTQVFADLDTVLQTELRLVRVEVGEKLKRAAIGGVLIGIAGALLLPGLFLIFLAAVRWLEHAGLPERWALLLVGGAVMSIAVGVALNGARRLRPSALVPDRTINQLRAEFGIAKEQMP